MQKARNSHLAIVALRYIALAPPHPTPPHPKPHSGAEALGPLLCNSASDVMKVKLAFGLMGIVSLVDTVAAATYLNNLTPGLVIVSRQVSFPIPSSLKPYWLRLQSFWTWGKATATEAGKQICKVRACAHLYGGGSAYAGFNASSPAGTMIWDFVATNASNVTVFNETLFQVDASTIDASSVGGEVWVSF